VTTLPHHRSAVARAMGTVLLSAAVLAAPLLPARPAAAEPVPGGTTPLRIDLVRDEQWQLRELRAAEAWRYAKGEGVIVAVLDSGVDATHVDLVGQVLPGKDFVDEGQNGQVDPVGHGTTVAALIAGRDDDSKGVVGLAPRARILPVRVLDKDNRYDDALVVANAVRWAVDHGAQVINMSFGGTAYSPALAAAIDYAFARDVVVVACTGNKANSSSTDVWYPAREPGVVAVAGMEKESDALWSGSITGRATVLTAPATGLLGARPGGYWRVQGTSFAAPLVAATAALIRSRWPEMSAAQVVTRLITTARDVGPPGRDDRFGFGVVDPVAALTEDVPSVDRNPLDDGVSPATVGFGPAPERAGADAVSSPTDVGTEAPQGAGLAARAATTLPEGTTGWLLAAVTAAAAVAGVIGTRHRLVNREAWAQRRREIVLQRVLARGQAVTRRPEDTLRHVPRRQRRAEPQRWWKD
jgi:type VII secretion-associated serine protease mycosin